MTEKKIDVIRNMIAEIGKQQIEYYKFFQTFADNLVVGLGKYLGNEKSVALTTSKADFQFDKMYRHEGLGLDSGKYRIPIMIKFDNLNDSGYLLQRIWLYCTKNEDCISVSINDQPSIEIQVSGDHDVLYENIYRFLIGTFSKENWLETNRQDFKTNKLGFSLN